MANKKITELPFIDTISGSSVFDNPIQNTVVPVVMYGTTNQITIENYAKFINLYSAHTGSAGNTFTGPQTINNNVTINGRLTVHELVAQYETSSILFSTGSTKLGDQLTDKHEFTGSTNITGSLFYNNVLVTNIDSNTVERLQQATASLQVQTGSQDLVNLGISTYTGSQNVINSSVDSHILTQATQTGSQDLVNNQNAIVTSSFRAEIGGIEAYTASLKGQAIVSSSTQITNYHKFAETASANTFYGNQSITGSLSISNGQFNIITGSGELTSSLSFRHTTIDPITGNATLELRYRNNDVGPENNAWKFMASDSGVALVFEQDGVDRTLLSSNDAGDALIFRDTRLFGKGLTVDNSLLVKGVITGSILATNGVVSSSNQLFELNQQTGSQGNLNAQIGIATGSLNAFTSSVIGQANTISAFTSSINAFTGSQINKDFTLSVVTSSLNEFTSSQISKDGILAILTSSIDAHILKQSTQTGSQDLVNLGISSVTGSLIGITNTLMAFTASLDNTYATDAQLYQLYQTTASIQFATRSLNLQTGSQDLVNLGISTFTGSQNVINSSVDSHILKQATQTGSQDLVNLGISSVTGSLIGITNGLMAFTASLDSTYATDAQLYQLYQATSSIQFATASLNTQTGSQNSINFNISVVTSSIDAHILKQSIQTGSQDLVNLGISTYTGSQNVINSSVDSHIIKQATQTGSQDLVNLGISTFTGSLRSEVNLIEAYTASLKGAIEVSGQNVNVLGMITAQQFNVTYVSSSVMYQSGSTKFGNSNDDKHEFTGSIALTGTQTIASTAGSGLRIYGAAGTHQWDTYLNGENLRISDNTAGDGALVVDTRASFGSHVTASGNLQLGGNLRINGGNSVRLYESTNTNYWDVYTYTDNTLRVNYKGAGGDEIILYNDGGINFSGAVTASANLTANKVAIGSTVTPTIPLEVYGQQKWFTTTGDGSELRGFFNPGGAGDDSELTLYKADGTTAGIKLTPNGIDFSANANAAGMTSELLSDYEEGTFTPFMEGSSTAGTGTYVRQTGVYTKIGNLVTCNVWLQWSAHTGTGDILLAGFPFTSISTTNFRASGTFGWFDNLTLTANNIAAMAMSPSETKASLTQYPAGGGAASSVAMDTAANLHYSITYQTA